MKRTLSKALVLLLSFAIMATQIIVPAFAVERNECSYKDCTRCDHTEGYNEHPALGHDLTQHDAKEPTCTEIGWDAYEDCSRCDYTTYVEKAALGHDLTRHDAKEPTCTEIGWDAYDTCSRCDHTTYVEKPALGHTEVIDHAVEATFDETGLTEGKHCSVCNEIIVPQTVVERKQENITFTYEATGINGSENAVNSGFVTLKVYMNVNSDIARLWGTDIDIKYSDFLTLLSVEGCIFEQNLSTPINVANAACDVKLTQDMGFSTDKTFTKGTYLFATLTFKVDKDSHSRDASFEIVTAECAATRDFESLKNELVADFGTGVQIHVSMLGDANNDGKINSADSMLLSKWFATADLDSYDTIYDMNKDGFIDGDDFALLRGAVVRDDSYLDI